MSQTIKPGDTVKCTCPKKFGPGRLTYKGEKRSMIVILDVKRDERQMHLCSTSLVKKV